ncbi:MAG: hypothetical protein ACRD1Z_23165, partial [Vicinamibacteria bacterium]
MRIVRRLLAGLIVLVGAVARQPIRCEASAAGDFDLPSPDGIPERLVLAIDGIPYSIFAELQERGHFSAFRPASRMISTFPSLSDVALATIVGLDQPVSYQVMHFDRTRNRIVGNTMRSLSHEAHGFLEFDSHNYGSAHRAVSYVSSLRSSFAELERLRRDFLRSGERTFVGYVEASDAVVHVYGPAGCERFLLGLERFLDDLSATVRQRTGRDLAIDLVSDHGSSLVPGKLTDLSEALDS